MARTASSFARRPARFKPQPRILILCEDAKSCRIYLMEDAQHFRCHVDVVIAHAGRTDPRGIVEEGKKRHGDYEAVYCAIDRDTHETFDEAVRSASESPAIDLIVSHPCYEFWLLLHFRKTRSPFACSGNYSAADNVGRVSRMEPGMDAYAKGKAEGLFEALLAKLPEARSRAQQILVEALDEEEMNPSTRLHDSSVFSSRSHILKRSADSIDVEGAY
ncbi:hypothetical protein BH09PSE5_BH09PSE5_11620 [soil metagenome]